MATESKPKNVATRRRRRPPIWLSLLLLVPIGLIVWLHTGDRTGDQGMTNVFGAMLGLVTLTVLLIWFVLARGFRLRTKLLTISGLALAVVAAIYMFPIQGVSGTLVPIFQPRWSLRSPVAAPTTSSGRTIDLAATTDLDFPGFLGPDRSNRLDGPALDPDWETQPPEVLWRQPIGAGWSGFAVVNGYAVTQEERDDQQFVTGYDAATGELIWSHGWPGAFFHPAGGAGPRGTPTIDEGRVYAMGPRGRFVCLDGSDGSLVWQVDFREEFGLTDEDELMVAYGRSGSPLVHGDQVIINVGGKTGSEVNLVAFDKLDGKRLWTGSRHQISYSSPNVATIAGVEQILMVNEDTVTGHDPGTGDLLWEFPWFGRSSADATSSQAVPIPPNSVLISKGYGVGAALIDLAPSDGGRLAITERWHVRRSLRTKFTNVVVRGDHAYGLSDGILECVDLATGRRAWKGGRYGHGQILGVGDHLIVVTEDGEVVLVDMTPETENSVLARMDVIDGVTWNNPALYGDLLLVRNGQEAAALRLPLLED